MKTYKNNTIFICAIVLIFSITAVFGPVITFGAASDWTDILKQYINSEFSFADINGDRKSELLIYDAGDLTVYANINNTYSEAGTVPCEDYSVYSADNNNGIAVSRSLDSGWCYDKYVLRAGKLEQDGVIASYEYSENNEKYKIGQKVVDAAAGRKKIDELESMYISFQTYEVCSTDDWYSAYKNVIEQYINIIDEPADISDDVLSKEYKDVNLNYILYERTETSSEVLYALKDLDNNNTPELIIASDTGNNSGNTQGNYITYNIYTFKDGVLVNFEEDMGDRYRCDILNTNEIYEESSGGAGSTYYSFYELNDGKFEIKDAYALLGENMGSADSEFSYSFKNGTVINDSELNSIVSQAKRRIIQPDWKPLNAYINEEHVFNEASTSDLYAGSAKNDTAIQQSFFDSIIDLIQAIADMFSRFFQSLFNFGNITSKTDNIQTEADSSQTETDSTMPEIDNTQTEINNNPDWVSVLKQYPDGCYTFEDIDADNIPELLILCYESLIIYAQDNNTYQLIDTLPSVSPDFLRVNVLLDHSGLVVDYYQNGSTVFYKYILKNGEIVEDEKTTNIEDIQSHYRPIARPYFICNVDDWHSAYEQVIEQYKNIRTELANEDEVNYEGKYKYVNAFFAASIDPDKTGLVYALEDIDNNGIPELLIASADILNSSQEMPFENHDIADIYTFKDGVLVSLDGGVDNLLSNFILNDNELLYAGGIPADQGVTYYSFQNVNDGKIENGDLYAFRYQAGSKQTIIDKGYKNGEPIDPGEKEKLEERIAEKILIPKWKSIDDFE